MFIDLRDHYGLTQLVLSPERPASTSPSGCAPRASSASTARSWPARADALNPNLPTGEIEVRVDALEVLSEAAELPVPVFGEPDYPEELRLKYRYLDLRRESLHRNIVLRSKVIDSHPPSDGRPGLPRVPDADPDRVVARGRARLPGAVAPASRASSTPCRRRRSSSSNC